MPSYLENLTIRLATGLAEVEPSLRHRHVEYLLAAQRADGGFSGREGESDLYYTGFALRGLAVLGELYGEPAQRASGFLRSRLGGRESIVDFLSLIYGAALLEAAAGVDVFADAAEDWADQVAAMLEELRREDGGYAKAAEGKASSTYHSFLVLLCRELIDRPVPQPERIVEYLHSMKCADGGFLEIRVGKRAGVNPTAAAIGALRMLDALDQETRDDTIDFLLDMQSDDGGVCANTRIPFSDLLSTFTGSLTLADLGGYQELNLPGLARFVQSLERSEGGFMAFHLDPAHDVEYTFYGIGCLALIHGEAPSPA
jgi:geranylgeranyl transferase type-2 subunit beta